MRAAAYGCVLSTMGGQAVMTVLGKRCEMAPEPSPASVSAADDGGLNFSSDCQPGIRRARRGSGFHYVRDDGAALSPQDVARIDALRIPPAWVDVWICADPLGHLQATGRDARGRKQYRYHARWHEVRDATKYDRLVAFGEALSRIRKRVDVDLGRRRLERARVMALVVSLMDLTLARVGNAEYLKANDSFGLTTLKDEHADVAGARVRLSYRGKAGKDLELNVRDGRVARTLQRSRDLPGEELFQYLDETGAQRIVSSGDVNEYLREAAGSQVTSKDFRTWGGSFTAASALLEAARSSASPADRHVTAAVKAAAAVLGNTPAVCRKSYIHPGLIELYRAGRFVDAWERARLAAAARADGDRAQWLNEDERVFLELLRALEQGPKEEGS